MAEERSETTKENSKDIFGLWAEGFSKISKVWQESYSDLFKPWMDSSGDFFERMTDLSHATDPQKSMEFYQDWVKTYQNTWGKFFPQLPMNAGKEDVQRMMDGAEELNKLVKSWSVEIKGDMDKTKKMMENEPSQDKIMDVYKMWCGTYEKIFDDIVNIPTSEKLQAAFEESTKIPSAYTKTMKEFSKLWKASYEELYSSFGEGDAGPSHSIHRAIR